MPLDYFCQRFKLMFKANFKISTEDPQHVSKFDLESFRVIYLESLFFFQNKCCDSKKKSRTDETLWYYLQNIKTWIIDALHSRHAFRTLLTYLPFCGLCLDILFFFFYSFIFFLFFYLFLIRINNILRLIDNILEMGLTLLAAFFP